MTTAQSLLQTKIKSKNACSDMFHTDYIICVCGSRQGMCGRSLYRGVSEKS